MDLRRKCSDKIIEWYRNDRNALLIKGARQVGKTYLIRKTLEDLENDYFEINLIDHPEAIDILINSATVDDMVLGLSTFSSKPIIKKETVIFIDEVQRCKEFVTKIKFLVDEGSYRYIMSGSLLGVEITNLESAPVGYLSSFDMYPLDFEEFLQISNISSDIINHLRVCFKKRIPIVDSVHNKMMTLFRQYLVIGGMPDAVKVFSETHNVNDVMRIHDNIIDLYKLDFTRYEDIDKKLLLENIYDLIPSQLMKQNKRYIVSDIKKGLRFDRLESSFLWLYNSGVALPVFNATEPRRPLKANEKQSLFKLYLSDVGMLTTMYGMTTKRMIISDDSHLNSGGIFENVVAQELKSKGFNLYYYNSNRLGELDFVIEYEGASFPIEVKSGKDYFVHSALNNCMNNSEYEMREAFVFANCNTSRQDKITYLPIYLVMFMEKNGFDDFVLDEIKF